MPAPDRSTVRPNELDHFASGSESVRTLSPKPRIRPQPLSTNESFAEMTATMSTPFALSSGSFER